MTVEWHTATDNRRPAQYADAFGARLFVQMTVRSFCAQGMIGEEYQASVGGVRIGEFDSIDAAKNAAIRAAEMKTAPPREPQGREDDGLGYDFRVLQPAFDY
jgi:hypothetical protein